MRFRSLAVSLCLWSTVATGLAYAQESPKKKLLLIEGTVETAVGCPVTLSEALHQRPNVITPQDGTVEAVNQVKIENISGRAIRKVYLLFRHDSPNGGMLGLGGETKAIGVGETLLSKHPYRFGTGNRTVEGYVGKFTAFAIAAEFEDGAHWVEPSRVDLPMHQQGVMHKSSPLAVSHCENIDSNYRATLRANSDQVVAYRLGVVKDTPAGFDVRVGGWMPMPGATVSQAAEFKISAADPRVSLPQSWVFKREKFRFERFGTLITDTAGVALFIAEVRLADGTIWKQDLNRDELLWGLYN